MWNGHRGTDQTSAEVVKNYALLRLVLNQSPVEGKHTGGDVAWQWFPSCISPGESRAAAYLLLPHEAAVSAPSSWRVQSTLSCTGRGTLPLCKVVALEFAGLAGPAGAPQELELLTWKELASCGVFFQKLLKEILYSVKMVI